MAFNHYAKIKRILDAEAPDWYVLRVNEPTSSRNFKGELRHYDFYYRVCRYDGTPIPYCKFQQLDRFLQTMQRDELEVPIIEA